MSIVARVVRSFGFGYELVTLERDVPLPATPPLGTRLDLRAHGVEATLEVVGLTIRPALG
jgi:hypothetical protein